MITIKRACNGFIVEDKEEPYVAVYGDEVEDIQEMMSDLINTLGYTGSRHDAERLYVRIEPGDKYERHTECKEQSWQYEERSWPYEAPAAVLQDGRLVDLPDTEEK